MGSARMGRGSRIERKVTVVDVDNPCVLSHVIRVYDTYPHIVGTVELLLPPGLRRPVRGKRKPAPKNGKSRGGS